MSRGILSKLSFASLVLWFVAMLHCANEQALAHCHGEPLTSHSSGHEHSDNSQDHLPSDEHPDLCKLPCLRSTTAAVYAPAPVEFVASVLPAVWVSLIVPELRPARARTEFSPRDWISTGRFGLSSLISAPNAPPQG